MADDAGTGPPEAANMPHAGVGEPRRSQDDHAIEMETKDVGASSSEIPLQPWRSSLEMHTEEARERAADARADPATSGVLLPIRLWADRTWAWRRTIFRAIVLIVTVAAVAAAVVVGALDSYTFVTQSTTLHLDRPLTLKTDECYVDFLSVPDASAAFQAEVTLGSVAPGIVVNIDPESNTVEVVDSRPTGQRYEDYDCSVRLLVPEGATLPPTTFVAVGQRTSYVKATGVSWGSNPLSLELRGPRTASLNVKMRETTCGPLTANYATGVLQILDGVVQSAAVTIDGGSLFMRLKHSVEYSGPSIDPASLCLLSANTTCDGTGTPCYLPYAPYGQAPPTAGANATITVTGPGYVHIMAGAARTSGDVPSAPYPAESSAVELSAATQSLLADLVRLKHELLLVSVDGPGAPAGVWAASTSLFYLTVPRTYMDIFSWRLLSPAASFVDVTLAKGSCPGLHIDGFDFENALSVYEVLRTVVEEEDLPFIALRESINPDFGATSLLAGRDYSSGVLTFSALTLLTDHTTIITIIFNLLVSLLAGIFCIVLLVRQGREWRSRMLDEWGTARYGDRWAELRREVRARTGLFFLAEFIVGYPKDNRNYPRLILTVWTHLSVIFLPFMPLFMAVFLWYRSVLRLGPDWIRFAACQAGVDNVADQSIAVRCGDVGLANVRWVSMLLFVIFGAFMTGGVLVLFAYYLDRIGRNRCTTALKNIYAASVLFFSVLAIAYVTNVAFWIMLGCMLQPNTLLPLSAIALVLLVHLVGTVSRVRRLLSELQDEVQNNRDVIDKPRTAGSSAAPSTTPTLHIRDLDKFSTRDLLQVLSKSKILEAVGLTVWERVYHEVVVFLIMLLFFVFISAGFLSLSPSTEFVSALTTGMIFIVGGGVNVPLVLGQSANRKQWLDNMRAQIKPSQLRTDAFESKKEV